MTTTVNGLEVGKTYTLTHRPRKADNGHTIVQTTVTVNARWMEVRTVTCQCGKRFIGVGSRPFYAHGTHTRKIGA